MRVELRNEARTDLVNGASFYGNQSPGLEDYFIECIRQDLQDLERTSGIHERHHGFYRKLSKRFPFAIYYLLAGEVIDVVAVLDCRSDPNATDARLGRTKR